MHSLPEYPLFSSVHTRIKQWRNLDNINMESKKHDFSKRDVKSGNSWSLTTLTNNTIEIKKFKPAELNPLKARSGPTSSSQWNSSHRHFFYISTSVKNGLHFFGNYQISKWSLMLKCFSKLRFKILFVTGKFCNLFNSHLELVACLKELIQSQAEKTECKVSFPRNHTSCSLAPPFGCPLSTYCFLWLKHKDIF